VIREGTLPLEPDAIPATAFAATTARATETHFEIVRFPHAGGL
jgi:hypothetical protein